MSSCVACAILEGSLIAQVASNVRRLSSRGALIDERPIRCYGAHVGVVNPYADNIRRRARIGQLQSKNQDAPTAVESTCSHMTGGCGLTVQTKLLCSFRFGVTSRRARSRHADSNVGDATEDGNRYNSAQLIPAQALRISLGCSCRHLQ